MNWLVKEEPTHYGFDELVTAEDAADPLNPARHDLGYRRFRSTQIVTFGPTFLTVGGPGGTMFGDSGGPTLWDAATPPASGHRWREPPVGVTSHIIFGPGILSRRHVAITRPEVKSSTAVLV